MLNRNNVFISLSLTLCIGFTSCDKEKASLDSVFYNEIKSPKGFIYYKGDETILPSSGASAHLPYFRVRYNSQAYVALTDNGKLPIGASFQEGAVVVKELYSSLTGELKMLAVMKKSNKDEAAQGWLWAEYNADGSVVVSANDKGTACISCHSTNSRDMNRLFDLFP